MPARSADTKQLQAEIDLQLETIQAIQGEMAKIIVGQEILINRLLVSLLTRGHLLLEGVPGLAKTTAISNLAKIFKLKFQRIQFTPDLLPSDLLGSQIYNPKSMEFMTKKGPLFANFILADEINRSPAKVQSALLEAMQEKQITIGETTFKLDRPFMVMATQNPIEQEGTYPLPEAQVDRFLLKAVVEYPTEAQELEILNRAESQSFSQPKAILGKTEVMELQQLNRRIYMDESIKKYIVDLVYSSRDPQRVDPKLKHLIAYGASPRASLGLMQASKAEALLAGRYYVTPDDVKYIAPDVLRHRLIPSYEAQAEGVTSDALVTQLLNKVRVP